MQWHPDDPYTTTSQISQCDARRHDGTERDQQARRAEGSHAHAEWQPPGEGAALVSSPHAGFSARWEAAQPRRRCAPAGDETALPTADLRRDSA